MKQVNRDRNEDEEVAILCSTFRFGFKEKVTFEEELKEVRKKIIIGKGITSRKTIRELA